MANSFGTDILIQAPDPKSAALFYVQELGFEITGEALGPVFAVTVDSVEEVKLRLTKSGCQIVKNEPNFPRCYIKDPFGFIYNITT
jgi:hypothetical protein